MAKILISFHVAIQNNAVSAWSALPLPTRSTRRCLRPIPMRTSSTLFTTATINANDGAANIGEEDLKPILRGLYDAPPQLQTEKEDGAEDGNNNATTATSSNNDDESDWVTEVTPGTLPTEEGSSHVLYYEVHRRFRKGHHTVSTASNTNTPEGKAPPPPGADANANNGKHNNNDSNNNKSKNNGKLTALFLHGGPGAGCFPNHVRFFSPELYETVVLLDQRGCGQSTRLGETQNNTLEFLVQDVERLRIHLFEEQEGIGSISSLNGVGVNRPWDVILGGSWGCTLALAYAHTYPRHVRAMVLRGVCLFRSQEIDWLFGDPPQSSVDAVGSSSSVGDGMRTSNLRSLLKGNGDKSSTQSASVAEEQTPNTIASIETSAPKKTASMIFPKGWKDFGKGCEESATGAKLSVDQEASSTKSNPRNILHRYYNLILGSDPTVRLKAVKSWFRWEMGIYSSGIRDEQQKESDRKTRGTNNSTLLVWNPNSASWVYEDAKVWSNDSIASMDETPLQVEENAAQSLRQFSSTPFEKPTMLDSANVGPMPIHPMVVSSDNSAPKAKRGNNEKNATSFDPTTYIPAHSMLTCYYSTNDDYCIGPYRPFLSLAPPSSMPLPAWYSSRLPPQISQSSMSNNVPNDSSSSYSPPLPPTIAIQGGNDAICPPDTALDLHHVWNELELRIALDSGHSMYDSVIAGEIVKATDRFGHALMDDQTN